MIIILFFVISKSLLNKHIIDRAINISSSLLGIISNLFLIKVFSSINYNAIATSIIHLYQNLNLSQFIKFFLLVALIFQFLFFILYLSQTTTIIYPDKLILFYQEYAPWGKSLHKIVKQHYDSYRFRIVLAKQYEFG